MVGLLHFIIILTRGTSSCFWSYAFEFYLCYKHRYLPSGTNLPKKLHFWMLILPTQFFNQLEKTRKYCIGSVSHHANLQHLSFKVSTSSTLVNLVFSMVRITGLGVITSMLHSMNGWLFLLKEPAVTASIGRQGSPRITNLMRAVGGGLKAIHHRYLNVHQNMVKHWAWR